MSSDQSGSSSRTWKAAERRGFRAFEPIWDNSVIERAPWGLAHEMWERPISAGVSSSWPTMTATVYGTSQNGCPHDGRMQYAGKGKPSLETMARKGAWSTPQAYDCRGAKTPKAIATMRARGFGVRNLNEDVIRIPSRERKTWPTATASDAKASGSAGYPSAHPGVTLTDATLRGWATPTASDSVAGGTQWSKTQNTLTTHVLAPNKMRLDETKGQALNPAWVESLMGFAPGWTDLGGPLLPGRSSTHGKRRGR